MSAGLDMRSAVGHAARVACMYAYPVAGHGKRTRFICACGTSSCQLAHCPVCTRPPFAPASLAHRHGVLAVCMVPASHPLRSAHGWLAGLSREDADGTAAAVAERKKRRAELTILLAEVADRQSSWRLSPCIAMRAARVRVVLSTRRSKALCGCDHTQCRRSGLGCVKKERGGTPPRQRDKSK